MVKLIAKVGSTDEQSRRAGYQPLYLCIVSHNYCSLCRKQSGVGYNLATLVKGEEFRWITGENPIASWYKPTGYRTDFCQLYGSTVPNPLRNQPVPYKAANNDDETLPGAVVDIRYDNKVPLHVAWRLHRGYSKEYVAEAPGIPLAGVSNMEKRAKPQKATLEKLARIYDCRVTQLY